MFNLNWKILLKISSIKFDFEIPFENFFILYKHIFEFQWKMDEFAFKS